MMFLTLKVHRKGGKDKIDEVSELKYVTGFEKSHLPRTIINL